MDEHAVERPDGAGSKTRRSGGNAAAGPNPRLRLLGEGAAVILFYLVLVVSFMWPLVLDPFNQVFLPSDPGSASDQNLIIASAAGFPLAEPQLAVSPSRGFRPRAKICGRSAGKSSSEVPVSSGYASLM